MKGRNLAGLEITPAMLHVRHATKIASEVTTGLVFFLTTQ